MQYAYHKLKGRIKELYGTQKVFAHVIGWSPNSVSKKLTGATEFSQSNVESWAQVLRIQRSEYGEYFYT